MIPPQSMLTIKNRAGRWFAFLVCTVFVAGCTPPGPRAVLEGKRLLEKKKYAQAVTQLELATSILRTNAQAFNYLGLAYHLAGRSEEAEKAYRRALALDRDLTEAHYNLGCLWLDENKLDGAKTELTAYVLRRASSPEGFLKLGAAQLRSRETAAAEKSFNEALRFNAANVEAITGLGLARLQRGRVSDAVDHFRSALSNEPGYGPALLNLAIVQQQYLQDRAGAIQTYRDYLALKPVPENANEVRAVLVQLDSEIGATARAASAGGQLSPTAGRSFLFKSNLVTAGTDTTKKAPSMGVEKAESSSVTTGNKDLELGSKQNGPTSVPPGGRTMEIARQSGRAASRPSSETTGRSPEIRPGEAADLSFPPVQTAESQAVEASSTNSKRGFFQRINPLNLFSSASKNSPASNSAPDIKSAEVTSGAGIGALPGPGRYVYLSPRKPTAGNRAGAASFFREALKAQQAHRLPEAIRGYRKAIQTDPCYFEAYYNLALSCAETGDRVGAFSAYEFALAVNPSSPDARYNFALLLKQQNYPLDAANELDKLLSIKQQETRAHLALGNLYAQQLNQPDKARVHYLKVLAADPQNPQAEAIRYWLADHSK